jgi:hypothetical protein
MSAGLATAARAPTEQGGATSWWLVDDCPNNSWSPTQDPSKEATMPRWCLQLPNNSPDKDKAEWTIRRTQERPWVVIPDVNAKNYQKRRTQQVKGVMTNNDSSTSATAWLNGATTQLNWVAAQPKASCDRLNQIMHVKLRGQGRPRGGKSW